MVVPREKFIAMSAYIKNAKRSQINNPNAAFQTPRKTTAS
jgi:hypothetical protein